MRSSGTEKSGLKIAYQKNPPGSNGCTPIFSRVHKKSPRFFSQMNIEEYFKDDPPPMGAPQK